MRGTRCDTVYVYSIAPGPDPQPSPPVGGERSGVGLLLQLGIGEELHRLHLRVGRLRRVLVDPRTQLLRDRLALGVERVGVAAGHAFAVRHAVLFPHLDLVLFAARRADRPGDEALPGDRRAHAASPTSPE